VHPGQKFHGHERLGDVIVRADVQPGDLINVLGFGRQHDDGELAALVPQLHHHGDAVHHGHHHIHNGQMDGQLPGKLQPLGAVGRTVYGIALIFQVNGDALADLGVVLHNKNMRFHAFLLLSGCDAVCRAPGGRLGGIVLRISILFT
jgi:hypothetical protein